ncbi:MAG: hypothetical protein ACPL6C_01300 [bacterium]
MLNKYIIVLILYAICIYGYGQVPCYDTSKVGAILEYSKLNKRFLFERFELLSTADANFIRSHEPIWILVRGVKNEPIDDITFLNKVGMEREARILEKEDIELLKRKAMQLTISLPLGIALGSAGGWWIYNAKSKGSKETLEYACGTLMVLSGIGIIYSGLIGYINAKKTDPTRHKITYIQALEIIDRYNKLLQIRCTKK